MKIRRTALRLEVPADLGPIGPAPGRRQPAEESGQQMRWMSDNESLFVDDDEIVLRDALDSAQKARALVAFLRNLAVARRIQIGTDELPAQVRREVLEQLNELSIFLLQRFEVELGASLGRFEGVGGGLLDEALRPRESTAAMNQIREAIRFTAIDLRRRAWVAGRRDWCPRCDQGWVVYAKVLDHEVIKAAFILVCEACEAAWVPGEALLPERAVQLSAVFGSRPVEWDLLDVQDAAE